MPREAEWCRYCGQAPAVTTEGACEMCDEEQVSFEFLVPLIKDDGVQTIAPAA